MCKYEVDLASIVEDMEWTYLCPLMDRRRDVEMDMMKLHWSGDIKKILTPQGNISLYFWHKPHSFYVKLFITFHFPLIASNIGQLWRPEPKHHCPACRTTLIATRFRVAVICPIIQVPHCIRVFFYFVWFVFINHIFQFYNELCTYCNILDIYLS